MVIRAFISCALVSLLCSCASTSLKATWKSPDYRGGPVAKVGVLVVDAMPLLREGFERRYVAQLERQGQPARTTFDLLPLAQIKESKEAAAKTLRDTGATAVLVVRLRDTGMRYREVSATREIYVPVVTGMATVGWHDYYSIAFADMGTTYASLTKRVCLDNSLFDLETGKCLWSAVSETVIKENTDALEEITPLAARVMEAMRHDGLIK